MNQALLEQVDFVITELSKSTNTKHAKERAQILTRLRIARMGVEGAQQAVAAAAGA